jgi:hypothetical protein
MQPPIGRGLSYREGGQRPYQLSGAFRIIRDSNGGDVRFVEVLPDAFAAALRSVGVPPWKADGLVEDCAHYARGEAAEVSPTVRDRTGEGPRDIARFARDHAWAFGSE